VLIRWRGTPLTDSQRDEHGRPTVPIDGDEATTLIGFLEFERATFAWKCSGLDTPALRTTVGASTMTLGGMLKHLAFVEAYWFALRLRGEDPGPPWNTVDWEAEPDWDWRLADTDTPEQLRAMWDAAVERSRLALSATLADGGLGQRARHDWYSGEFPSARWIVAHMTREYARHNGHADLLREAIDGETGE
jgi:hypothetical protein